MCAIFGIGFMKGHGFSNNKTAKLFIERLFLESESRGTHATGIAVTQPKKVTLWKKNIAAKAFVKTKTYKETIDKLIRFETKGDDRLISLIGHCRWETKGSHKNNLNNHPIVAENIIGIHNGVISNDEDLFATFTKIPNGIKRAALVDSEIIFRLIEYYRRIRKERKPNEPMALSLSLALGMLKGGFACAMLDRFNPYMLWLFKNSGPIYVRYHQSLGMVVFSTSNIFINNAEEGLLFGMGKDLVLKQDSVMELNLKENKVFQFNYNTKH